MDLKVIDIKKENSIISNLFLSNYEDYNNSSNKCTICYNSMINPITLECNHSFCYQCLLESYKGIKCNFYLKTHRICPYCRHPGNYLPLKKGLNPIKGIHREYGKKKKKVNIICSALLKSGPNRGKKCGCKVKDNGELCGRHKEKTN